MLLALVIFCKEALQGEEVDFDDDDDEGANVPVLGPPERRLRFFISRSRSKRLTLFSDTGGIDDDDDDDENSTEGDETAEVSWRLEKLLLLLSTCFGE